MILIIGAFSAGFVDAVAGGGGLIQLPVLMMVFPTTPFVILSGTNKIANVFGTIFAALRYSRSLVFNRTVLVCAVPIAICASWFGARTIAYLDPGLVKPIVICALIVVGIYTALRRDLGAICKVEHLNLSPRKVALRAAIISIIIGFYDGFIGPGTGSFLIFAFILFLGFDFLNASATAKIINIATNVAAISYFVLNGKFMGVEAVMMGASNVAGSLLGSHMALLKGNKWIRRIFLLMVTILLGRLVFT